MLVPRFALMIMVVCFYSTQAAMISYGSIPKFMSIDQEIYIYCDSEELDSAYSLEWYYRREVFYCFRPKFIETPYFCPYFTVNEAKSKKGTVLLGNFTPPQKARFTSILTGEAPSYFSDSFTTFSEIVVTPRKVTLSRFDPSLCCPNETEVFICKSFLSSFVTFFVNGLEAPRRWTQSSIADQSDDGKKFLFNTTNLLEAQIHS